MPWTPKPGVWYDIPTHWPADGTTVWVRRIYWESSPFKASFDLSTYQFTTVTEGLTVEWWVIASWRLV